jgi:hypothetical protein
VTQCIASRGVISVRRRGPDLGCTTRLLLHSWHFVELEGRCAHPDGSHGLALVPRGKPVRRVFSFYHISQQGLCPPARKHGYQGCCVASSRRGYDCACDSLLNRPFEMMQRNLICCICSIWVSGPPLAARTRTARVQQRAACGVGHSAALVGLGLAHSPQGPCRSIPIRPHSAHANPMPTPCQCQPHASPNPMLTPCQLPTPCQQPHANARAK